MTAGIYSCGEIGSSFRRLSIIDLEEGHQPLSNEDETIWIAFNGEIYNFQELNQRFLSSGHTFQNSLRHRDYHRSPLRGTWNGLFFRTPWHVCDCPCGMAAGKKLILARDRVGKKPLFYSFNGRRLVFGSEIKTLWPAGGISKKVDLQAVADYFSYQYIPAPKTIYSDVRKLRAGHYLEIDRTTLREVPYWDIRFDQTRELPEDQWCDEFLEEYRSAVKTRLISDVPLGAFLSAGVDSSSVVALMNEFQSPVTTCSIGFTEKDYNEADDARKFAIGLHAKHFEEIVTPNAVDLIPKLAWHYDEPFADSSAIPTYYVSRAARQRVTVALSGDGGDENFAGYRRYKFDVWENQLRSYFPTSFRKTVFGVLGSAYPKLGWAPRMLRAKSTFQSLARDPIAGYFYGISICPPAQMRELLNGEVFNCLGDTIHRGCVEILLRSGRLR